MAIRASLPRGGSPRCRRRGSEGEALGAGVGCRGERHGMNRNGGRRGWQRGAEDGARRAAADGAPTPPPDAPPCVAVTGSLTRARRARRPGHSATASGGSSAHSRGTTGDRGQAASGPTRSVSIHICKMGVKRVPRRVSRGRRLSESCLTLRKQATSISYFRLKRRLFRS